MDFRELARSETTLAAGARAFASPACARRPQSGASPRSRPRQAAPSMAWPFLIIWSADITYLWTLEGWLDIAALIDLFSRRVVGWAMAEHMREPLVNEALQMALGHRCTDSGYSTIPIGIC